MNKFDATFLDELDSFVFLCDKKGAIHFANRCFLKKFGKVSNIREIKHLFSVDICVLDDSDILQYSPVESALLSKEQYFAVVDFEESYRQFRKVILKVLNAEDDKKLFIISYADDLSTIKEELNELKTQANLYKFMKKEAENQTIKASLLNRVSASIRDTIDKNEIIEKSIEETIYTLGASSARFYENKTNKTFLFGLDDNTSLFGNAEELMAKEFVLSPDRQKLFVSVKYREKSIGYLLIEYSQKNKLWRDEEIQLVVNICSQLAIAINQAYLFEELDNTLKELRDTQLQLVQSEKMASLGHLVAGIAHEINTPIGVINSNNDLIKKCVLSLEHKEEEAGKFGVIENSLDIVTKAIDRINKVVKSLKNFARLDEADMQDADINEGILSTLELLNHEFKNRIAIETHLGNIPKIKCHPNLLNQVFMNLLINASQSIEAGGKIIISSFLEGNTLVLSFKDNGTGIKEENLSKIFDPGFTTKGVGVGTGLGLSICFKIIEKHGGIIDVKSKYGEGSEFLIKIPVKN